MTATSPIVLAEERARLVARHTWLKSRIDGAHEPSPVSCATPLAVEDVLMRISLRQRRELNAARSSVENSSGSSQAAKWPPLSASLK